MSRAVGEAGDTPVRVPPAAPARLLDLAPAVAERALRLVPVLVDISSPFGDADGAGRMIDAAIAAVPHAAVERLPCSTPGVEDDLLLTVRGRGRGRVMLLGHVDTVIPHADHRPHHQEGDRIDGSGTIDMKGGDAIALAILAELADAAWAEHYERLDLLLVCDEEWRRGPMVHAPRFDGHHACLCFEAGERDADGHDAVIVRRKAAGSIEVTAEGRAAHAGAAPDEGASALLALARTAQRLAGLHDPDGPLRRSVVPTMLSSGEAVNVVPGSGELICDVRAVDVEAIVSVLKVIPHDDQGVALHARLGRSWPGMDSGDEAAPVLRRAAQLLGRPIVGAGRGGASDASHVAGVLPLTIDGLGPLGDGSHATHEHMLASSVQPRVAVALAILQTILDGA